MPLLPNPYKDVPEDHWARGTIALAHYLWISRGYRDGTFRPDANVTRAEAVSFVVRSVGVSAIFTIGGCLITYLLATSGRPKQPKPKERRE